MGPPFHFQTGTRMRGREALVNIGLKDANGCTLRLARVNRAIVAPTAGTTRDVLAEPLAIANGEVMLVDLAGLDAVEVDEEVTHGRSARHGDLLAVVRLDHDRRMGVH